MKAYLFGSIFYEKDIEYNKELLLGIRRAWPGIDIYAPQEAPFNDKRSFGDSKAIFDGDYARLKETDLLIGCLDGDIPPIGSTCEAGLFCGMAKNDSTKQMIVLHTDTRDGYKTWSQAKFDDMANKQCHSQMNYFNLFLAGTIEECGTIVGSKEQLFDYVRELYYKFLREHHISGIYMITNRTNGKRYIGLSKDVYDRLDQHRTVSRDNPQAIDQAIQKYGIENFTFELLEQCDENILSEREIYWCEEVFGCETYAPNGYNIARAGGKQYGIHSKVISSYTLLGKKIKTYPSILAAAHDLKCNPHSITQAIGKPNRSSNNMRWESGIKETCEPLDVQPHGQAKKVDVYDETLQFLGSYKSIAAAADAHNANFTRACASYNTPGLRANKLYFVPEGAKPIKNFEGLQQTVYCYDMRTRKYIASYNSAREASKNTAADPKQIRKCAKGDGYYGGGYIWSFIKFDEIPADYRNINKEFYLGEEN